MHVSEQWRWSGLMRNVFLSEAVKEEQWEGGAGDRVELVDEMAIDGC